MAVPARRTSKMRKNTRRSHDALMVQTTTNCPNCGAVVLPHHACLKCNTYKGVSIFPVKETKQVAADNKEVKKEASKKEVKPAKAKKNSKSETATA